MKASDYIAKFVERQGVTAAFEMSGGMITHMLDSFSTKTKVRLISVHHEQAAAFAADAYGRMTGVPGVAMATSGPGATNLLTGIGSCYFDSSPAVFITGQVNRHELRGKRAIRQLGFQETDIVSMSQAITKAAWMVETPEDLGPSLARAFKLATSGRPGPVLLDIPMDIQRADVDELIPDADTPAAETTSEEALADLVSRIESARRPLLLLGGGVSAGRAMDLALRFADKVQVPVVNSLMGADVMPYNHPLRVGMIGSYGNRWANLALSKSDLIIVLGSRLDIRQTGNDVEAFRAGRCFVHVDCEPGEINNRVPGCVAISAELRQFFADALSFIGDRQLPPHNEWMAEINALRTEWSDTNELREASGINPNVFMHELSANAHSAAAYLVDVGQHQMWAAQSVDVRPGQRFMTSGGMGSMGFALPAAIGASIAAGPDRPVVVIAGDGGFQANIQELQTVVRNQMPVKIVVINNGCHGMVRQFQESYFNAHYQSTLVGYSCPDFAKVAEGYGIEARTVSDPARSQEAADWLWNEPSKPQLLQVMVDTYTNAYPKIAFGRPISEMEPFAQPIAMEST